MTNTSADYTKDSISFPDLQSELHQFEQNRLKLLRNNRRDIVFAAVAVILALSAFYWRWTTMIRAPIDQWLFIKLLVILSLSAFTLYKYAKEKRSNHFQEEVKSGIINQLLETINPMHSYSAKGLVFEQEFRASGIFYESLERFSCEDSIKGQIDRIPFHLAEVHAEVQVSKTAIEHTLEALSSW